MFSTESLQSHFHCLQIYNAKKAIDDFVKPFCMFRLSSTAKEGKYAVLDFLHAQHCHSLRCRFCSFRVSLPGLCPSEKIRCLGFSSRSTLSFAALSLLLISCLALRTLSVRKSAVLDFLHARTY